MLKPEDLTEALHMGVKTAERCSRFCKYGADIRDEKGYWLWHNGTGSRDTDAQVVYAPAVLAYSTEKLTERLTAWIAGLHTNVRVDLNEGG